MATEDPVANAVDDVLAGTPVRTAADQHGADPRAVHAHAWATTRHRIATRDHDTCQACGAHGNHDVHHRQPRGIGGTSSTTHTYGPANLIQLCRPCHQHIEQHRTTAYTTGHLVHSNEDPASIPVHTSTGLRWYTDDYRTTAQAPAP